MQCLNSPNTRLLPASSSEASQKSNTQAVRPKLAMIWVKEFEGEHQHLVARWVQQN
jgi:hypothetical protein